MYLFQRELFYFPPTLTFTRSLHIRSIGIDVPPRHCFIPKIDVNALIIENHYDVRAMHLQYHWFVLFFIMSSVDDILYST